MLTEIRPFDKHDEAAVVQLWQDCALVIPANSPHADIRRKLTVQPDLFLVGLTGERVVATVMGGYEGHRGWINYLAVAREHRRQGIGRRMVEEVEKRLRALGCPKINLQVRTSNTAVLDFYRRVGYAEDDVVSMGKRLVDDRNARAPGLA